MREDEIIAVDEFDKPLHPIGKVAAHEFPGVRHRAITVFLENDEGKWLLAQRSMRKPLWPLWWDGACSTHQMWPDEDDVACAKRRIPFELGVRAELVTDLQTIFWYSYSATYNAQWVEKEVNHILIGSYTGEVNPNPKEVAGYQWLTANEIAKELAQEKHRFAPWFPLAWEGLQERGIV